MMVGGNKKQVKEMEGEAPGTGIVQENETRLWGRQW